MSNVKRLLSGRPKVDKGRLLRQAPVSSPTALLPLAVIANQVPDGLWKTVFRTLAAVL